MTEQEKHLIKMKHKLHRLKIILERFAVGVIDENEYTMANELYLLKQEIENTYEGMEFGNED